MSLERRAAMLSGRSAGGGDSVLELIGETTIPLAAWTDTANYDNVDTGINISNTDYAWGIVIITCDTPVIGANDWGATFANWGRYTSNANLNIGISMIQRGTSTASFSELTGANTTNGTSYGVAVQGNKPNVIISRKCHATACPLCRAGNYTVKVYGLKRL